MNSLKKVAVVTGSSSGIGRATSRLLAQKGYAVAMFDIVERDDELQNEIESEGGVSAFLTCDVAVESDVKQAVNYTLQSFGRIDVLVNNAGIVLVRPLDEITWDE